MAENWLLARWKAILWPAQLIRAHSQKRISWIEESQLSVMRQHYEYKFVRVRKGAKEDEYQRIVEEHARKGWRLVQILAPGARGLWASPNFVEVVLEREVDN